MTSLSERLWSKVDKTGDCWTWTGAHSRGYGYICVEGRMRPVHRVVYELTHGSVGELEIDHLCHTRDCVKMSHLRAVTHIENMRNLSGPTSRNKSGHLGVYWHRRIGKWTGAVGHEGRIVHVGYFETLEEAAAATARKRLELHGHIGLERDRQKRDKTLRGKSFHPVDQTNLVQLKEAQ